MSSLIILLGCFSECSKISRRLEDIEADVSKMRSMGRGLRGTFKQWRKSSSVKNTIQGHRDYVKELKDNMQVTLLLW